jgi:hypothetical protein
LLLYPNIPQKLLLFGGNFSNVEEGPPQIAFTSVDDPNGKCDDYDRTKTFDLVSSEDGMYATVSVILDSVQSKTGQAANDYRYICLYNCTLPSLSMVLSGSPEITDRITGACFCLTDTRKM